MFENREIRGGEGDPRVLQNYCVFTEQLPVFIIKPMTDSLYIGKYGRALETLSHSICVDLCNVGIV